MPSLLQTMRWTATLAVASVACLLGVTKLTDRLNTGEAYSYWQRIFESNYGPALENLLKGTGFPSVHHAHLRLGVGISELLCGTLLLVGSRAAAGILTVLMGGLLLVAYRDSSNGNDLGFLLILTLLCFFLSVVPRGKRR